MDRVRPLLPAVIAMLVGATPAASQGGAHGQLAESLDSIVRVSRRGSGIASASVAITRGDTPLFAASDGSASIERQGKAQPTTTYAIASISKEFAAAAILRLAEHDALSLDAPIARYLAPVASTPPSSTRSPSLPRPAHRRVARAERTPRRTARALVVPLVAPQRGRPPPS